MTRKQREKHIDSLSHQTVCIPARYCPHDLLTDWEKTDAVQRARIATDEERAFGPNRAQSGRW